MRFVTTGDERSPEELAARIFGTRIDDPETTRAANALVRANPELRRIDELPPTLIPVPSGGVVATVATAPLPAAAISLLLGAALDHVDEIETAAKKLANENVAAARAQAKELESAELARRARADKGFAEWLKEAKAEAKAQVEEGRKLVQEQKVAMRELKADLDALVKVLAR